jgi:ADP-ribosylation factor GTPase-activating protein 1
MSFGGTPTTGGTPRSQTPLNTSRSRTDSPSRVPSAAATGKVKVDDRYFASLGQANASRPEDLPPSQGGKYAGFGSSGPMVQKEEPKLPGLEDLQRDPVAALTKGFGWFTTTVGKTAKSVNDGYIVPTAQKVRLLLFPNV